MAMAHWLAVIPAFQAADTVADVVAGIIRATALGVIVVDDGSSDATGARARGAGARVLRHEANLGKGAALMTGFALAAEEGACGVLTLDADGQHATEDASLLLAAHRASPEALIMGVRDFHRMPRRSRTGNAISTWWISRFAGRRHRDTQTGFRVYPRRLFAEVKPRSARFATEVELLLRAAKLDIALVEVPVTTLYPPEYTTHFRDFRDTLQIIRLVISSPWWTP